MHMVIRDTLDFNDLNFDRRVLLQVFALKTDKREGLLPPALAILAQNGEKNDDNDSAIIAYKLDEYKMNRLFFELRNKKIVLLNAFQMLSALDFKPAENYECLRSALFVLERQYYKQKARFEAPKWLPPCLGNGVEIPSLDDEMINVYLSHTKTFLEILAEAEAQEVFSKKFYKHVRGASEYCLQHNKDLPDLFQHPFISATGYVRCIDFSEKAFEKIEKKQKDVQFFKLDIGEINFMFYCVLLKQNEKIKETPTSSELQAFYTAYGDNERHARYLGLQVYYEILWQLVLASYVPFIIDGTRLIFAFKKGNKSKEHIERAISISYGRMRNIATSIANNRLGKLNTEAKS